MQLRPCAKNRFCYCGVSDGYFQFFFSDYSNYLTFSSVCDDFESTLEEFEGESDHVHLLVTYPPKISVSRLVNSLKGVSSRRLRQEFPEIKQYYWKGQFRSPSYFAGSCGGAPLEVIQKYIENQNSPS